MNIKLKKAAPPDEKYLLWLRKATMGQHLQNSGMEVNEESHLKGLLYKYEIAEIIFLSNTRIGLLKKAENDSSVEIIQIQIEPDYQGKGIGQYLIRKIIDDAALLKKAVSLSVLKANPARKLYERLGFKIVDEDENSFIMKTQ
ncbi:MAG: GNAT family N-acetyltransferase [Candidatus Cyclobacteriaceae bacterium M2_1C_046]